MTEKYDVTAMAEDARTGKGCSILDVMQNLNLNEQIQAMRDLRTQAPDINVTFGGSGRNNYDLAVYSDHGHLSLPKFFERVSPIDNKISYFCRDVTPPNNETTKNVEAQIAK